MMPNIDPKAMKNMMAKMGIKTEEIEALRVVIECNDRNIVIEQPQVTKITAQGVASFQIGGAIQESQKDLALEVTDEDIKMVMEKTGVSDRERAKKALEDAQGDIATAILNLTSAE